MRHFLFRRPQYLFHLLSLGKFVDKRNKGDAVKDYSFCAWFHNLSEDDCGIWTVIGNNFAVRRKKSNLCRFA